MKLREYLDREKITVTEFGRRCGVQHSTVLRWIDRAISPSADALLSIHRATGGAVTPNDMLGITEGLGA